MMRTITAFIGVLVGANLGWIFGTVADKMLSAWALEAPAGHRYAILFAFIIASVFGAAFWQIAGWLKARQGVAVDRVEHAQSRASRGRVPTGKTPPSPFPALQA